MAEAGYQVELREVRAALPADLWDRAALVEGGPEVWQATAESVLQCVLAWRCPCCGGPTSTSAPRQAHCGAWGCWRAWEGMLPGLRIWVETYMVRRVWDRWLEGAI